MDASGSHSSRRRWSLWADDPQSPSPFQPSQDDND